MKKLQFQMLRRCWSYITGSNKNTDIYLEIIIASIIILSN